jgi:hypothetical protein
MIFDTTNTEPTFVPKTLKVTFQTQKEYSLFHNMLGHNMTIPQMIADKRAFPQGCANAADELGSMMSDFRTAMESMK